MPKYSNEPELIEVTGRNAAETDLAVLCDNGSVIRWLPKSVIEDWPDKHQTGVFLMPEWIAIEKGLI